MQDPAQGGTTDITGGQSGQKSNDGDTSQASGSHPHVVGRYHSGRLQAREQVGGLDGSRLEKLCGMEATEIIVGDTQFQGRDQPLGQFGGPPLDVEGDAVKGQPVAHPPPKSKAGNRETAEKDGAKQTEAPRWRQIQSSFDKNDKRSQAHGEGRCRRQGAGRLDEQSTPAQSTQPPQHPRVG